jgi:hypothetical protein
MNIEEARKVLWLKSNHRPLGELLDEGYLTKDRLEWAAKWAYNSSLQKAAQVILDALNRDSTIAQSEESKKAMAALVRDTGVKVGISLVKAHSTAWPFTPYKGQPMGKLVESKLLTLKDLAYAIENAWDAKVRQAATAFSLIKLDQIVKEPVPSAGFVHVVSGGRSYAERRESLLTLLEGMVLGWSSVIFIALVWWLFSGALEPKPNAAPINDVLASPAQIIGVFVVLAIVVFGGWAIASIPDQITKRLEKQIEEHRRGQEGEDSVAQLMAQALDGNWHIFRNISLPGRNKGDLDLVLVGPPGVWALEVKNLRGEYHNIGETWEWKNGKNWKAARGNPSRQANNSAYRLKNFLKADNVNVFVNTVVVWANPESPLLVENPSVAVWRYDRLPDELGNIWQGERLSETERNKIVEKLIKLCERQKQNNG